MDGGQAGTHELFGDVRHAMALALLTLLLREHDAASGALEDRHRAICDAAAEPAGGIAVERAARRIGRVPRNMRQLECLAVVIRRVAAAMMHADGMVARDLVEVLHVQLPVI